MIDANLLLFAVDADSPFHDVAESWLTQQLNGPRRVGLPWQSLVAFVRISTHPRAARHPLSPSQAWSYVTEWLDCSVAWVPSPGERYGQILGSLLTTHHVRGNLIPDAQLAALALEHGSVLYSADSDFARFPELRWVNPVAPAAAR